MFISRGPCIITPTSRHPAQWRSLRRLRREFSHCMMNKHLLVLADQSALRIFQMLEAL
jgi:hypothetical protein